MDPENLGYLGWPKHTGNLGNCLSYRMQRKPRTH